MRQKPVALQVPELVIEDAEQFLGADRVQVVDGLNAVRAVGGLAAGQRGRQPTQAARGVGTLDRKSVV